LDIFKGLPFYFENYALESVSYLIRLLGLSSLSQFICQNLPSPRNIQEAIDFLSNHSCDFYPRIFNESMTVLIDHFSEIRTNQFLKMANFVLEKLFQSTQLQIDSENILFDLVVDLIGRDPNRKILLRTIFFPGVSFSRLISYFNTFTVEEMDYDLFESLKIRLFCDVFQSNSVPSSAMARSSSISSKEEFNEIINLVQSYFHKTSNSVELIKKFKFFC
jgi:hypothetical protein